MSRLRFPFSGTKLVQCKIAFLVMFAGGVMACQAAAQVVRQPADRRNRADHIPPQPALDTPEPAEAEEGPPEKKYDSLPVDMAMKKKASEIGSMEREGKFPSPDKQALFDDFFKTYFLSRWSVQEDVRQLVKFRSDLSAHLRTAKGGIHDSLVSLALDFLKELVTGNYHPAVKINAMLAIGELNRVEASGRDAAVPLPQALDVLIAVVENNSSKFSEGLRATAMVGVLRHASAGIPSGDAQKKVNDAMLRLAAADVPAGSALSARAWMVAQAAETLGALGAVGEHNDVFAALLKLVADAKLPLAVRCAAADALGRLNYSSADGINSVDTAATLGRLAIDSCKDGLATAKDTDHLPFRRRMLQRLCPVLVALGGDDEKDLKAIALVAKEPPQKAFLTDLRTALREAVYALDYKEDPHLDPQKTPDAKVKDMKETVTKLQNSLEQSLQKKP